MRHSSFFPVLSCLLFVLAIPQSGCAQTTSKPPTNLNTDGDSSGNPPPVAESECLKAAPAWARDLPEREWQSISLNTFTSVDPEDDPNVNPNHPNGAPWRGGVGQRGVISAWNGGAFACKFGAYGSLIAYGGGHNDYYGSEIYAFDLETRLWSRITYDYIDYDESTNRLYVFKGQHTLGPPSNSTSLPVLHVFNFETLEWEDGTRNGNVRMFSGGHSAYDPRRKVFWIQGAPTSGATFAMLDPSVLTSSGTRGEFTNYPTHNAFANGSGMGINAVSAIDPVRDIFVYPAFRNALNVWARDLSDPETQSIAIRQTGDLPPRDQSAGFEWSPARQAFLWWRTGTTVYELRPPASNWRNGDWVWSRFAVSQTAPAEPRSNNGAYSKFRIASFNEFDLVVIINEGEVGNVYAMRIPKRD